MKQQIQAIDRESFFPENKLIVSKTDTKGCIVYGNDVFIEISGFQEHELLGKQHNIVRHPDMPRAVFKLLWDTLQAGDEFNGYVKNLCKDGGFYWAFASVAPSHNESGQLIGHHSVRRKPNTEALSTIKTLYNQMLSAEQHAGSKDAITTSSAVLNTLLTDKGVSYDQFVCAL